MATKLKQTMIFGSRLVYVESIEESGSICKVKDMSSLLAISEELHQPVLCCLDEDELPEDGKFIIQDGDKRKKYDFAPKFFLIRSSSYNQVVFC